MWARGTLDSKAIHVHLNLVAAVKCVLCAGHCVGHWRFSEEQDSAVLTLRELESSEQAHR